MVSSQMCRRICFQVSMESSCGCYWPQVGVEGYKCGAEPCSLKNTNHTACYKSVRQNLESQARQCPCDLACEDNRYKFSLSNSVWPSNKVESAVSSPAPDTELSHHCSVLATAGLRAPVSLLHGLAGRLLGSLHGRRQGGGEEGDPGGLHLRHHQF